MWTVKQWAPSPETPCCAFFVQFKELESKEAAAKLSEKTKSSNSGTALSGKTLSCYEKAKAIILRLEGEEGMDGTYFFGSSNY